MHFTDTQPLSSAVLPHIHLSQHNSQQNCNSSGSYNRDLSRQEVGRVFSLECQWSDDVSETERHKEDGIHGYFFGMAGIVGAHPRVQKWEGSADGVGKVGADLGHLSKYLRAVWLIQGRERTGRV